LWYDITFLKILTLTIQHNAQNIIWHAVFILLYCTKYFFWSISLWVYNLPAIIHLTVTRHEGIPHITLSCLLTYVKFYFKFLWTYVYAHLTCSEYRRQTLVIIWCEFDRALSLICGNKMPTRCKRWFLYSRSYCLFNKFWEPLCPPSGAEEHYTGGCCLWYLVLYFIHIFCTIFAIRGGVFSVLLVHFLQARTDTDVPINLDDTRK